MKSEDGVYYHKEAYAGFLLRLMIDLIDLFIVLALCALSTVLVLLIIQMLTSKDNLIEVNISLAYTILITWILVWFAYFVLLKHSKFGTVGYRIGHVKIVNLQGNDPSVYSLTLRLMFAVIGPVNILLDLLWIPSDPHRQSLRDKFASTYVVKLNAQVAGRGKIIFRRYSIMGWNLLFREVDRTANRRNS